MLVNNGSKIYAGDTQIIKAYQGETTIYEKKSGEITSLGVSNGQYIDTGIVPSTIIKVEMKVKATPRTVPSAKFDNMRFTQVLFGSRNGWKSSEYAFWFDYAGSDWQTQAGSGSIIYSIASTNNVNALPSYPAWGKDCIVGFEYGKFSLTYDGEYHEYPMRTSGGISSSVPTIWLFNLNSSENLTMWFNGDWYYTKIWDRDTLVRDFVPALDENDIPCMYDKVSETYFYNQGTGNFTYK